MIDDRPRSGDPAPPSSRSTARRAGGLAWTATVTVIGLGVIALGVVLLPLPGPGLLVIVAGLGLLATQYEWARRLLTHARDRAQQSSRAAGQSLPATVLGVLGGLALIGIGVVWGAVESLPLSGFGTAAGLVFGGLVLIATTLWGRASRQRTTTG